MLWHNGLETHRDKTPILYICSSYAVDIVCCMLSNIVVVDSCFWATWLCKQQLFHSRTCARAFGQHFASTFPSSSPVLCICSPLCTGSAWAQDWHSAMGMCFSMATAGRDVSRHLVMTVKVEHLLDFLHWDLYLWAIFSDLYSSIPNMHVCGYKVLFIFIHMF